MLPNQVSYLKGSSMESFTLGPTPKIDLQRTVERTLTTARELANLQISLNTISKNYEILYLILIKYKLIYRLTENLILIKFRLWQVASGRSLSCVQAIFCDRLSRITIFYPKTRPHPDGLTESLNGQRCHSFPHQ